MPSITEKQKALSALTALAIATASFKPTINSAVFLRERNHDFQELCNELGATTREQKEFLRPLHANTFALDGHTKKRFFGELIYQYARLYGHAHFSKDMLGWYRLEREKRQHRLLNDALKHPIVPGRLTPTQLLEYERLSEPLTPKGKREKHEQEKRIPRAPPGTSAYLSQLARKRKRERGHITPRRRNH